jgi:hypothetical protein
MKIETDSSKYLSKWKYIEIAHYVDHLDRVIRLKNSLGEPLFEYGDIEYFRGQYNNTGLYTSIWLFDHHNIDESTRFGPLYFDIDNQDEDESYFDCATLVTYLNRYIPFEAISIFFTGKKGYHIECDPKVLGINPSNNLPNIFRYIANTLKSKLKIESLDLSVYDARRMWRLEGSRHQGTGLFKNRLSEIIFNSSINEIKNFCSVSNIYESEDISFDSKANEWFREFSYQMEIDTIKSKDFISYFNRYGANAFKKVEDQNKEFTKDRLLNGCTAVSRLLKQAKETGYLEHEARLFLCSILTYTEDSVQFLHEILSNCKDYNVQKSESHIRDWIRRRELGIGGRPYTCERANSAGVGCGECQLDKRNKWTVIGDRYVETEEKSAPSPIRFGYKTNLIKNEEIS